MFLPGCIPEASSELRWWESSIPGFKIGSGTEIRRISSPFVQEFAFRGACSRICSVFLPWLWLWLSLCLYCSYFHRRTLETPVLGTIAHTDVHEASVTILGNCFLQSGILENYVSRKHVGCSFAIVFYQLKL
jgi:hypothetical protein